MMAGMNPGGNPFPGGVPTGNPFPGPGGNPFQPNRRIFPQPTWRTGRSDWQVDATGHLDYSVNDQTPRGKTASMHTILAKSPLTLQTVSKRNGTTACTMTRDIRTVSFFNTK